MVRGTQFRFISPPVAKLGSATCLQQTDPIFPGDVNQTTAENTQVLETARFP